MRLTIDIREHKADFVLELLDSLKEFVHIEQLPVEELSDAIPAWKSHLLEERWAKMEADPQAVCSWEQSLETLGQKPLKKS